MCSDKPLQLWPQVPGGLLLADAFLRLDELMSFKLLIPEPGKSKQDVAGAEGGSLKRLCGALRYLFRSSTLDFTGTSVLVSPLWL